MKWKSLPIIAFDTETTGLEPFGGDRIIELAVVELAIDENGQLIERSAWSTLVNPERDIPRKVTEITGIRMEDVADKPRFADVADKMWELLSSGITVAHNYPFDLAFLTREFDAVGRRWPEPIAEVDTVDLSMRCFRGARSHRLVDLAERLGITLERAHRATDDASACGAAFVELARRFEVEDDLQAMLDWSNAIGRPPEGGPIGLDKEGRIVFLEGELLGEPVVQHPIHLGWMDKARERSASGWRWRYPEGVRRWIRRWLDVRGSGRAKQGQKGTHAADWVLDPCIAAPRQPCGRGADGRQAERGAIGAAGRSADRSADLRTPIPGLLSQTEISAARPDVAPEGPARATQASQRA